MRTVRLTINGRPVTETVDERMHLAEIYRLLVESNKLAAPSPDGIDFHPMGVKANRRALELVVQYSVEQEIIPRAFTVDELFDGAASALGET